MNVHPEAQQFSDFDRVERSPELRLAGAQFLEGRLDLLQKVNPVFLRHAEEMVATYNDRLSSHAVNDRTAAVLEGLPSNERYYQLIQDNTETLASLWPVSGVEDPLVAGFGINFERLKALTGGEVAQVEMVTRYDEIDGRPQPYPVHTHVDVINAMRHFGMPFSMISVLLAVSHDLVEVGRNLIFCDVKGPSLGELSLDMIEGLFAGAPGIQLATGIPTLTETAYDVMVDNVDREVFSQYEQMALENIRREKSRITGFDEKLEKIFLRDQMEFGGLAVKVNQIIKDLKALADGGGQDLRLTPSELRELANAIPQVELGDRFSDMATIEGDCHWFEEHPEFVKVKTMPYVARLYNMWEKVRDAVKGDPAFDQALTGYLAVMHTKIDEINLILQSRGVSFTQEEFRQYYRDFSASQALAERAMAPFMREHTRSLLSTLAA